MLKTIRSPLLRRVLPGVLSLLFIGILAACSGRLQQNNSASNPAAPDAANPLVLRIATSPSFPPFEFKQADGTLAGFDIELINAIGEATGFLIDFDEVSFDEIIRNLYTQDIDAAISAISITDDRAERVAFSRPYFKSGLAIAVAETEQNITSTDSLRGTRIGVEAGTTSEIRALAVSGADVRLFNTATQALQNLAEGNLNAVINDIPVTTHAIKNGSISGIKLVGEPLSEEWYGIATPKNSPYLETINSGLSEILQNGAYTQIYQKWFAGEPPQLP